MNSNRPKAVVLGDVVVDVVTDLSQITLKKSSDLNDRFENNVVQLVGGSARNVSIAAIRAGFSVSLISKIGSKTKKHNKPDANGQFIIDSLKKEKINPLFSIGNHLKTGKVIIVYLPNDKRIMVSDRGASVGLSRNDLSAKAISAVKNADLLYVDGYNSLKNPMKSTAKFLMELASKHRTLVAFDVVPHKIYKLMSFKQLRAYTKYVDVICFELNTARRFLEMRPVNKPPQISSIIQSLKPFTDIYKVVFTRSGNNCLAINDQGLMKKIKTNYGNDIGIEKRGYFDKAFTKFLCKLATKHKSNLIKY